MTHWASFIPSSVYHGLNMYVGRLPFIMKR